MKPFLKKIIRSGTSSRENSPHRDTAEVGSTGGTHQATALHDFYLWFPNLKQSNPPTRPDRDDDLPEDGQFGLVELHEPASSESPGVGPFNVDIVAIHGLGGSVRRTWTHKNGVFWLRDLLPSSMPGARIFSYGYPSDKYFSSVVASIRHYAEHLLNSLKSMPHADGPTRPIIYICHSLGGIVFKEAMNIAFDDFQEVWMRSKGVIFLGTPHRGSATATRATAFGQVFNLAWRACGAHRLKGGVNTALLQDLSQNSSELARIARSFTRRAGALLIVTFFEMYKTPPSGVVIVDESSAVIGVTHESSRPLWANHRDICRFEGKDSNNYKEVLDSLQRMAENVLKEVSDANSSVRTGVPYDETEKTCVKMLNIVDVAGYESEKARQPVKGTLQWILNNQQYTKWLSEQETKLLWVTGYPGNGKTVLSSYIVHSLSENVSSRGLICRFFFDGKIKEQQDPRNLLRSVIHQIVDRRRRLLRLVTKASDRQGFQLFDRFEALWDLFVDIIRHEKAGPIDIVVDAIDECEEETQIMVVDRICGLLKSDDAAIKVKFFMTSRPKTPAVYALEKNSVEYIRLDLEEVQDAISEDVNFFVRQQLESLVQKNKCHPDVRSRLEGVLIEKAEKSFLWVSLVLSVLEERRLLRLSDLQTTIQQLPPKLESLYERLLESIPDADREIAGKLLRIVAASARPLTLEEIRILLANGEASSLEAEYTFFNLDSIQVVLGPLIRVSDSRVSLIHQSLKDYLMELANHKSNPLTPLFGADLQRENLTLALACMRYLALDDLRQDMFVPDPVAEVDPPDGLVPALSEQVTTDEPAVFSFDLQNDTIFNDEPVIVAERCAFLAARYKLYDYAAMHWPQHFAQSNNEASLELHDSTIALCNPQHHCLGNCFRYFWTMNEAREPFPNVLDALVIAGFFGHPSTIRHIFSLSRPSPSSFGAALYWAARRGHIACVNALLSRYEFEPGSCHVYNQSPLAVAAQYGRLQCVKALVACGRFDINERGQHDRTPISLAAGSGHERVVAALLSRNDVDVNLLDSEGYSPLFWAVAANSADTTARLLADPRVNPNHLDHKRRSALSWAAADGCVDAAKELITQSRTDLNSRDSEQRTPLIYAAKYGNSDIVDLLVHTKGLDFSCQDKDGRNAISWAAGQPSYNILHCLLSHHREGADVADKDGWTPLAWALDPPGYPDNISVLLQSGLVNVNRKDDDGRSTLSFAASYGYVKITQLLVRINGVEINSRDKRGETPLHYAASSGSLGVVQVLLNTNGIEVDPKDDDGRTPLSWAASAGRLEVVGVLSRIQGIDIGSVDTDGHTPLWYARRYDRHDVASTLESIG